LRLGDMNTEEGNNKPEELGKKQERLLTLLNQL
jgi:hypothetical protein